VDWTTRDYRSGDWSFYWACALLCAPGDFDRRIVDICVGVRRCRYCGRNCDCRVLPRADRIFCRIHRRWRSVVGGLFFYETRLQAWRRAYVKLAFLNLDELVTLIALYLVTAFVYAATIQSLLILTNELANSKPRIQEPTWLALAMGVIAILLTWASVIATRAMKGRARERAKWA